MTCRHGEDDKECSSYKTPKQRIQALLLDIKAIKKKYKIAEEKGSAETAAASPDAARFEIDEVETVGPHVVVKVLFPNCAKCAYEGKKVLVYLGVTLKDVIKWRRLDPHFRATGKGDLRSVQDAPSPAARFPASAEGWQDALAWAASKGRKGAQGGGSYVDIHEGGTR